MSTILKLIFWNPVKLIVLSVFGKNALSYLKINLLSFLSRFGYTNSQNRMDILLYEFFKKKKGGVFLEVGGADGIDQSNSLLLAKRYNWKGYLVEPVNSQFKLCKKFRTDSDVSRYAFVSNDFFDKNPTITINRDNLQSSISEKQTNGSFEEVPAITLDKFIISKEINNIDIMILDVEGFEQEVLDGYFLTEGTIKYLLVESWNFNDFKQYADRRNWKFISMIGNDYLFNISKSSTL